MTAEKRGQFGSRVGDSKKAAGARSFELVANYCSTYHLDDLKRMFQSSIDADVIEMIWQESSEDGRAAYEMLLAMDDGILKEPAAKVQTQGSIQTQSCAL